MLTPGHNLIYIDGFLGELFQKYNAQIFVWNGEHAGQIHSLNQFYQCYTESRPLLKSELKQFKESKNLNNDEVIVLDHTSFQSIANYIYNALDYADRVGCLEPDDEIIKFPPLKLGSQLFASDLLMSLDPDAHEKIAFWHCENNYPLHLQLKGYAKNKLMDFIKHLWKYPHIILYFDNLLLSDLNTWLSYLKGLPVEKVVGLNRTWHKNPEYSEGQAALFADYINSLTHLRFLHVTLETSVSPLIFDLSQHSQLGYLSIHSRSGLNYTDPNAIPTRETADLFLSKLPSNLRYLQLPAWRYSFKKLNYLLTVNSPQLFELSVEPKYIYKNDNTFDGDNVSLIRSVCRPNDIQFTSSETALQKPSIKLFSDELLPYVNGRMCPEEEAFNPFRYTEIDDVKPIYAAHRIRTNYLNEYYDELVEHIKSNQELSVEQLNEKIDSILQKEGDIEEQRWFFYIGLEFNFNITLFLLLLNRIESIRTLIIEIFPSLKKTDSRSTFELSPQIAAYKPTPPKIEYFKFYCTNANAPENAPFFHTIFTHIQITHHASLPGQFLGSNEAVHDRIQSIKVLEIDDASTKGLIDRFPEIIISSNMRHCRTRKELTAQSKKNSINLNNDDDTLENPKKTFSILKVFDAKFGHEIPVNYHRMRITSGFRADENLDNQPKPKVNITIGTDQLTAHYWDNFANKHGYYLGTYQFAMQEREWSIIPILGADDILFLLEANEPVELRYQRRQRAYEIRSLQPMDKPLSINYMIKSSALFLFEPNMVFDAQQIIDAKDWLFQYEENFSALACIQFTQDGICGLEQFNSALPQTFNSEDKAKLICAYFSTFTSGILRHTGNLPHQIDQAIFSQRLGSCRHRAKLAHKLFNAMGIGNNLVGSNVHLFLDLIIGHELVSVCLGGFRANTNILSPEEYLDADMELSSEDDHEIFDKIQLNEIVELQKATIPAVELIDKNPLLLTYPELDFPTPEVYQLWLKAELNKTGLRRQVLLLVDSLDMLDSLEQQTLKYIHKKSRIFATVDNFQRVKFFELHINGSEQHQQDNELGALVKNGRQGDVLWVPIQNYQAATINPLFDHRRQLKNKTIPQNVLMIALMEHRQFDEMSDDFISRFSTIYSVQRLPYIQSKTDEPASTSLKKQGAMNVDSQPVPAEFIFGAPYLSFTDFAGGYELKGKALQWIDGWLTYQLQNQATQLSLINAPFFLPEFDRLMKSIKKGNFYSNGTLVTIPEELTFHFKEMDYICPVCFSNQHYSESTTIDFVLNKLSYINFFKGNYRVVDGQLDQSVLFDFTDSKNLNILVTDHFDKSEWYSLFIHADRMNLKLNLIAAAGIFLPGAQFDSKEIVCYRPRRQLTSLIEWIECKKPHEMMSTFARQQQIQIYLSSRTTVSDLLGAIGLNESNSEEIIYKETDFTRALKNGLSIMLYGDPSEELRNAFESLLCTIPYLLINGEKEWIKESLKLCFTISSKKSISAIEHKDCKMGNAGNVVYRTQDASRDHNVSNNLFNTINTQRITLLTGLTPSIKPFWLQQIKSQNQVHQLTQWLTEGGVFILDHYNNATLNELELVEQFYHAKGSIYFQGKIYTISAKHKVVLLSSSKMTINDPAILLFNSQPVSALDYVPLSQSAYKELVIWPALRELCPDSDSLANRQNIEAMIDEYSSSRGASLESVAGSALTVLYFLWQSKKKVQALQSLDTALFCDLTLQLLCPKRSFQHKEMRNTVQFMAMKLLENHLPATLLRELTPMQSLMALNLLIQLSLLEEAKENEKLRRMMVKGILFEGAPGIGKTYLSLEILKSLGYREATLDDMETGSEKTYIQAPTDDLLRCKKILKFAQERGYIVLLDELNTISFETTARNERSVIAELTEAMEAENERNRGFFVIANQNTAASYSNRITLSSQLLSLFMMIDPGHFRKRDYRFLAMVHKAEHPKECAKLMKQAVKAYEKKPGAYRPPTIRTLLDYIMTSKKQVEQPEKRNWIASNKDEIPATKRRKLN